MKLIVQRVSRATVEVDGYVQSRIGSGVVLSLALRIGDTVEKAKKLAAQVVKLKIWPDMSDPEKICCTNVVENGYEILVVCQQSLNSTFPKMAPSDVGSMEDMHAEKMFQAFVAHLRKEYQEEMVVDAPFGQAPNLKVEATLEGAGMFELGSDAPSVQQTVSRATIKAELNPAEISPDVASVTTALKRLPGVSSRKAIATLEACRIFNVFSLKKFRAALADAPQADADKFAEALDAAAGFFSRKQQEQITAWTGMAITAPPAEELAESDMTPEEALALRQAKSMVKIEREKADWSGRAAPNTPGASAPWAASYKGYKGGGKRQWTPGRSYGIASLDESLKIHGAGSSGAYDYGQLSALPDAKMKVGLRGVKEEQDATPLGAPPRKRPKGTPTIAPQCPGQEEDDEEVWDEL
jgi:D-tyrosyl-tRNA(Tyr) deacylase